MAGLDPAAVIMRRFGRPDLLDNQLRECAHHRGVELAAGALAELEECLRHGELGCMGRGGVVAVKASQTAMIRATRWGFE